MPFISKNPNKAKYLIRSTTIDGTKKHELCDNKDQVSTYLETLKAEKHENIAIWTRTPATVLIRPSRRTRGPRRLA